MAQDSADPEALPGELAATYEVLGLLGEGASARVLHARRRAGGAEVVLKLLEHDPEDPGEAQGRFEEEARVLEALRHPRVVDLIEAGSTGGCRYIAYAYEAGETLEERLAREGPPGLPWVRSFLAEAFEALAHVHAQGVVHRDLKPANVLLTRDAGMKLMDFGIAAGRAGRRVRTRTGEWVGTPAYAAPGHLKGEGVDARDDLYSLGVVAYELLTGVNPFRADGPVDTMRRHLNHLPEEPAGVVEGVPRGLSILVMQLIAKRREDRPASAQAAGEILAEVEWSSGIPVDIESTAVLETRRFVVSAPIEKSALRAGAVVQDDPPTRPVVGPALVAAAVAAGLWVAAAGGPADPAPPPGAPGAPPVAPGAPPLLTDPLYVEDLRGEVAALGGEEVRATAERDPLSWERVLARLPSLRAFLEWVGAGGTPEVLPAALLASLREVDGEFAARGLEPPMGPVLLAPPGPEAFRSDAALRALLPPGAADVPVPAALGGWAGEAARALVEAMRLREDFAAEVRARPAGPYPQGIHFPVGFTLAGGDSLWRFVQSVGPVGSNRSALRRWLGEGVAATRRALYAAGRSTREEPATAELVSLLMAGPPARLLPFYCAPFSSLDPEVVLGGPQPAPAGAFLAGVHAWRCWRIRKATGSPTVGILRGTMARLGEAADAPGEGPAGRARRSHALAALLAATLAAADFPAYQARVKARLGEILELPEGLRREVLGALADQVRDRRTDLGLEPGALRRVADALAGVPGGDPEGTRVAALRARAGP